MNAKLEIEKIVKWLDETVETTGTKGLIVGISGGIDSAVVTHLVDRTKYGKLGLIMPCGSNPQDRLDAHKVLVNADLDYFEFDLTQTHETMKNQLGENGVNDRLSLSNLKARLRMSTLYSFAQQNNYLVVGTDNACEWHIGYFTKFGDGGVDLVPIIEYTKGEVRELAKELNIHEDIITKKPSAGLWEGQSDEDELGISYDVIDAYLSGEEVAPEHKAKIDALHERSAHKRDVAKGYSRG